MRLAQRLAVDDPSGIAAARRAAERLAGELGLDEQRQGEAAIVVTELATNLIRHAQTGEIVLRPAVADAPCMDVVAWDRGPGIANLGRARGDGFSTAGGSGTGLGAVHRLSSGLELHSAEGRGTVATARVGGPALPDAVDGLALAMRGEEACGDAWSVAREADTVTIALADGLGHGPSAAQAALAATRELRPAEDPAVTLDRMHGALQATRGAAIAVARLDLGTGALRFAGVGNIAATVVDGAETKSLASMNGIIGHRLTRITAFEARLGPGALLIMHSDGCRSGWRVTDYPGLQRRAPLATAATLIRDYERGRDDVSVVVARTRAAA